MADGNGLAGDAGMNMRRAPKKAWYRAAFALGILSVATAIAAGMVFLTQTLLARGLGPERYGLFASSLATVTMIAPLAGFGLSRFRLKVYGEEGWGADRWLRPTLRLAMLTTAAAIAIVVGWALLLSPDAATRRSLLLLAPVVLGLLAVDLVGSKQRLEERHKRMALWQLVNPGSRLLLVAALMAAGALSVDAVLLGYCAIALLVTAVAWQQMRAMLQGRMALHGHGPRDPHALPGPTPGAWQLWSQAWAFGMTAVLFPIFFQVGTVMLKYLDGNVAAGHYGIALAVMVAIYRIPAIVYQKFLLPKLHRWAVHDKPRFWQVYRHGNLAMLLGGLAVGGALALGAPLFVRLAFGEAYLEVATILLVLALCVPLRFLGTAVGAALLDERQMRYRVLAMAGATVLAIGGNALLIPRYAELGAAIATVLAEAFLLLAIWAGVRRFHPRRSA